MRPSQELAPDLAMDNGGESSHSESLNEKKVGEGIGDEYENETPDMCVFSLGYINRFRAHARAPTARSHFRRTRTRW